MSRPFDDLQRRMGNLPLHIAGCVGKGNDVFTPMKDLSKEQYNALMYGSDESIQFSMSKKNGEAYWMHNGQWEGLIPQSVRLYGQTASEYRREELEKFMRVLPCPTCIYWLPGTRLAV